MMLLRGGITALLLAACTAPPPPDPWTLWTIDTLIARGDPAVVEPGGFMPLLRSPYPALSGGNGLQQSTNRGLTIFPAFSEGDTAAYMTTEVWENFDEIWVQPLYVDLSGQNAPIFGVDSGSRFYSPYWQIFSYVRPPGAGALRDVKALFDTGATIAPLGAKFCAITRDATLSAAVQQGDSGPVRPISGEAVATPRNGSGYAAGNDVRFIDLGNQQRFFFDPQTLIVEETPLFAFARADANGFPVEVDLPKVGGTGPRGSPRCDGHGNCTGIVGGIPEFGSLWRIYDVLLPAGSDVYVPASMPDLQAKVRAMGFAASVPDSAIPPGGVREKYALRVYLNGAWLDSQNAIEQQMVDWRITQTGKLVTCPLVEFLGKAVPVR
jgi:hypothetical protein